MIGIEGSRVNTRGTSVAGSKLWEVLHGSTDTTAASGLPVRDFLPCSPCREGGHLQTATLSSLPARKLSDARHRACLCARTAQDNKARDIVVLDMRAITPLFDFFVIATGTSRRQIHALAEGIDAALREEGDTREGIEGYEASKWIVQDYGDILVHIFDPDTRQYYTLEELWADAKRVDWERE
ncbi:MAG: ribosome silencing factor [Planctomycetes bacterium]|nr:ribosome silencing factor [Planctomycetota bacterium]